jgi:uncharacterized protein involved in outer membrane biogenesis
MKTIFKWIKRLVLLAVVLLVVAVLARNFIVRQAIQIGARQATGFPLTISAVDIGLFNGKLEVKDLKLSNPKDFEESRFVDLPRLYVDYKLGSMLALKPHLLEMEINLAELVVVKNAAGEYNVMKLKNMAGGSDATSQKKQPYQVDTLHLKVGTVIVKDYSRGNPTERVIKLNLDKTYKNLNENTDISKLVLASILPNIGLPDLSGFTNDLTKQVGGVVGGVTDQLQKTGKGLFDAFKKK